MKKMNKTHYALNGHYSVLRDDVPKEDLKMNFYVDHKKGSGYESVSLINLRKADYCEKWDHEQMVFPAIKKSINETNYPCPPKKGHYALINYIPDTSKIPPGMPEGLYRLTFEFFDKEEIVGGYKIYADVTEEAKVD
ncbi:uncharacterized protein LOC123290939 [Chrysoperla carnea]|uniref:uncharacterized protein LOC123290939 n=1 Tax=Chrysoperla carnea TaxID=189513 RepID=UPI001D064FF0|nr:uncharacterized protein LOC123290939 [Chrysoperla carnea]